MSTGIPLFRKIQSGLDLNGPQLNMQQQPVGTACSVASGIATFIGIGTAIYPPGQAGRNTNTGTVTHQWYKVSPAIKMVKLLPGAPIPDEYLTKLTEGVNFVGTATTTLTLKGLTSPTDNDGEYLCRIGYEPNELSPNAINEPFDSSIATVGVQPTLSITTQPADSTIVEGVNTTFSIVATNSDPSYDFGGEIPTPLQYQWVLDGTDLVDGTIAGEGVVSGSKTDTLTISRTDAALYKVFCRVTSTNANPGIITSTEAKLDVATSRALLKFERYSQGTVTVEAEERDLAKLGSMSFRADADRNARIIAVWAPEEDVEVKVTVGGAAGAARNGNRGGTGGISVFRTTLIKGDEYIIKLGVNKSKVVDQEVVSMVVGESVQSIIKQK